jgi:hypothetical protein
VAAPDSRGASRRFISRFLSAILIVASTIIVGLIVFAILVNVPGFLPGSDLSATGSITSSCTVTAEIGKFWTRDGKSVNWQDGTSGMVMKAGNFLKTDAESRVLLTFFDGSTLAVGPSTDLQIEQVDKSSEGSTTILVKQFVGRTWSLVKKLVDKRSTYEIQTPSAKAMVRGTSFFVDVDENGSSNVQVLEGVVAVKAKGQEISVSAGNESYVLSGMPPAKPVAFNTNSVQDYQNSFAINRQKPGPDSVGDEGNKETVKTDNNRTKNTADDWSSGMWLTVGILALLISMLGITVAAILMARKVENGDK